MNVSVKLTLLEIKYCIGVILENLSPETPKELEDIMDSIHQMVENAALDYCETQEWKPWSDYDPKY